MVFRIKHIMGLIILILISFAQINFAQKSKVPVDLQIKIIPKILSLNKKFNSLNNAESLNLMIIFSKDQRNSVLVYEEMQTKYNSSELLINKLKSEIHPFDISNLPNIREFIKQNKIKVLYITPLRGVDISEIAKICEEEKVLTITGVEEYKENNISVILDLTDNKIQIIINQKSAKREGADFSSKLLKIAKIID